MSGSARSRLQMYLLVALICGASTLVIEFVLSSTSGLRGYANRQINFAVRKAVRAEVTPAAQVTEQR